MSHFRRPRVIYRTHLSYRNESSHSPCRYFHTRPCGFGTKVSYRYGLFGLYSSNQDRSRNRRILVILSHLILSRVRSHHFVFPTSESVISFTRIALSKQFIRMGQTACNLDSYFSELPSNNRHRCVIDIYTLRSLKGINIYIVLHIYGQS